MLFTAAIACFGVYEEISDVGLILGEVKVPGVFVIRNQYQDPVGAFCRHREEGTHQSGADSSGGMGDLEFLDEVEMPDQVGCDGRSAGARGDIRTECNEQIFLDDCCIVEGDRELRERLVWFGLWGVFVAQLGKSVIGTDEEVVTADVGVRVVWKPF